MTLPARASIITVLRPNTTASRSLARGGTPVPSLWRATAVLTLPSPPHGDAPSSTCSRQAPADLIAATFSLPQLRNEWPHLELSGMLRDAWEDAFPALADDLATDHTPAGLTRCGRRANASTRPSALAMMDGAGRRSFRQPSGRRRLGPQLTAAINHFSLALPDDFGGDEDKGSTDDE